MKVYKLTTGKDCMAFLRMFRDEPNSLMEMGGFADGYRVPDECKNKVKKVIEKRKEKEQMKRITIITCMILCVVLGACSVTMIGAEQNRPIKIWLENTNGSYETAIIVDENTGVNYIIASGELYGKSRGIAITPRLNKDGTLYVTK